MATKKSQEKVEVRVWISEWAEVSGLEFTGRRKGFLKEYTGSVEQSEITQMYGLDWVKLGDMFVPVEK